MQVIPTRLPGVLVLKPRVFTDARGFFLESFNEKSFAAATGFDVHFVQDNHSRSRRRVLRGIHYQLLKPQGRLVRVVSGSVFDVAVDLRRSSPSFGQWAGVELSDENTLQVWIPPGFGHGFAVRGDSADVAYKTTDYWYVEHDRAIAWNDPDVGIDWQLDGPPVLAEKDARAPRLRDAEVYE